MKEPEGELAELQDPARWDWERAVTLPPVADPEVVLEIRFGAELADVAAAARQAGLPVGKYIHQTVVEQARAALAKT